jgi:predicted transposase/invertase (TIGR01784 family)
MQVLNHQGFEKRVLYNAAKNYSVQLKRSDNYHLLNPVIALSIVDFDMFEENKNVITNFKLLEKKQFINYSDDIELIFIELPKFNKELNELKEITDQWIYFVKNAGDLNLIPNELDDTIKLALESVNEATLTTEELELQHKRKEFIYIQNSSIKLAEEQGLKQGIKQGIEQGVKQGIERGVEQGIEQRNLEIAKNLLDVLDDKTIAQKTGLAAEKIKMLR